MSEACEPFRDFISENFKVSHVHSTLADQAAGKPCLLHPECTSCPLHSDAQLAVLGTPCNPYSKGRVKRWADDSVKSHVSYDTTFKDTYAFLQCAEPRIAILEQVDGFLLRFSSTDAQTPHQRPSVDMHFVHFIFSGL